MLVLTEARSSAAPSFECVSITESEEISRIFPVNWSVPTKLLGVTNTDQNEVNDGAADFNELTESKAYSSLALL